MASSGSVCGFRWGLVECKGLSEALIVVIGRAN